MLRKILSTLKGHQSNGRKQMRLEHQLFNFDKHLAPIGPQKFLRIYGLSVGNFEVLHALCYKKIYPSKTCFIGPGRPPVSSRIVMLVTLRMLACASYLDVSWPYGIAFSTVRKVFDTGLRAPMFGQYKLSGKRCSMQASEWQATKRRETNPLWV